MKKIFLILFMLLFICGCESNSNEESLNVLNWSSYIPDEVIHNFEEEYNIKVNYGTYSSNEELLAKISSSKEGTYDVIFPSDYMVELMIERDMIEPLDYSKLHNVGNIDGLFLRHDYDKNNWYSLPFLSTIVVIVYDSEKIKDNIISYNDLLNSKYENDIVLLDDQRIVIGMAMLANGYSMNETSDTAIKDTKEWLLKLKKNVKAYDSDSPKTFFITGETSIGVMWNAEAELAKDENPNLRIVYPSEGHAISTDNYCIVKGAKNKDNAYLFIDYLMRNEVAHEIVTEYPYISPTRITQVSNVSLDRIYDKGYYVNNIGSKIKALDKLWADIK